MTTRFNSRSNPTYGVQGIQSGHGGLPSPSSTSIPSVGIEDADAALFNLFDKEIPFQVSTSDKNREEMKRVPVIFASAEKWALAKRQRGVRDKNGSLILPLITVVRTTIQQLPDEDVAGRGINQQTGELIVQRRLDQSDRVYQSIINRALLKHQSNLAVEPGEADSGQLATTRPIGDLQDDPTIAEGGLMMSDKLHNVYETLVVPAPQFYTAVYEVTFWTQYTVQMFQLLELLISSFLPQGNAWKLDTPKGYWFIATVDGNTYNAENNVDDMSQEERIIKHKFTVKVPGYILASSVPGAPIPVKRYVSYPEIVFTLGSEDVEPAGVDEPFLGSDDPTLPDNNNTSSRRDQRLTGHGRLYPQKGDIDEKDPALKNRPRGQPLQKYRRVIAMDKKGNLVTKFARVVSTNRYTGETVFAPGADLGGITTVVTED